MCSLLQQGLENEAAKYGVASTVRHFKQKC